MEIGVKSETIRLSSQYDQLLQISHLMDNIIELQFSSLQNIWRISLIS